MISLRGTHLQVSGGIVDYSEIWFDHVHGYVLVWYLHDWQWYQWDFVCLPVGSLLADLTPVTHVCHIFPQSGPVKPVPQVGGCQVTGKGSLVGDSEGCLSLTNGENKLAIIIFLTRSVQVL